MLANRKWWIILIIMKFYMPLNMSICDILEIHNIPRKMLESSIFIGFVSMGIIVDHSIATSYLILERN